MKLSLSTYCGIFVIVAILEVGLVSSAGPEECEQEFFEASQNVDAVNDICPLAESLFLCLLNNTGDVPSDSQIEDAEEKLRLVFELADVDCSLDLRRLLEQHLDKSPSYSKSSNIRPELWILSALAVLGMISARLINV